MESSFSPIVSWVIAVVVWFAAPAIALAVSVVYFRRSKDDPSVRRRLATSSHGVAIALLYLVSMTFPISGAYDPKYGGPFAYALIAPLTLIAISLVYYRGSMQTHWLQIPNALSLAWTGIMGSMAITGQWL